jgi:excisionase family DNA binding protein
MEHDEADSPSDEVLTLAAAAERLGVHYMTAYRYVRTGRLPAERVGGTWRVRLAALVHVVGSAADAATGAGEVSGVEPDALVDAVVGRLVNGDRPGVVALVDRALLTRTDPVAVYLEVLGPAMARIGDRWAAGSLSIAQEHRATVCMHEVLGQLAGRFARPGRRRGMVVVGAVPGDPHGLPTSLLREALRLRGFEVADLGASAPVESYVDAVGLFGPVLAVGVCATTPGSEVELRPVIDAVRRVHPGTLVFAGGAAVQGHAHAERLGLPVYTASPYAVLQLLDDVAPGARRSSRPS